MDIILNKDVENLGFKDDIVSVKNGYGRNYLIPKGYAILATPSAKKNLAEIFKQRAKKEEKLIADAKEKEKALKGIELKITTKVGDANKLFGSINAARVAEELYKKGQAIDKKLIKLPGNNIKKAGKHTAKIRLHRELLIDFDFEVISDKL